MAINFKSIADRLLSDAPNLLAQWLPAGKRHGREYVVGGLDGAPGKSLSINIDTGVWKDFASGSGGADLISLYAAIHNIKQGEAAKQFSTDKDIAAEEIYLPGHESGPIPAHSKYGKPEAVYEYRDASNKIMGYICRFPPPNPNEKKQFIPRTFWRRADGTGYWRWKKWPCASPLYNLPELINNPNKPVLIVEGEKTAIRAQQLLSNFIVVTWCGGAEAIKSTDWQPLKSRYCWIWPDADEPGRMAALGIKKILPDLRIVKLPADVEEGWDLGDAGDDFPVMNFLHTDNQLSIQTIATPAIQPNALVFTHMNDSGKKPLGTVENLYDMLQYYNITCRYNVISKRVECILPDEETSTENADEYAFTRILSRMKQCGIPTDGYLNYLTMIADKHQYNPVLEWIRSVPWDRVSRLPEFYDTITSTEEDAKELLMRRWLISALSMAMNNGIDGAGCLVLQGAQNLGKTWWVKKLVPEHIRNKLVRTDTTVDPKDKDSVSQVISYWICELGEIGATFRKADIDAIKSFITRDHDIMRRPYGIDDKRYPRRTAFVASVDQDRYLHDTAGNRRFWTIPCTAINSYHDIDMQQLWAEVLHLIEHKGESWRLDSDELANITRINQDHQQIDPIEEMIRQRFNWDDYPLLSQRKTATQICEILGLKPITPRETRAVAAVVKKINGNECGKSHGMFVFSIPMAK